MIVSLLESNQNYRKEEKIMTGFAIFILFAAIFIVPSLLARNEGKPHGIRGSRY